MTPAFVGCVAAVVLLTAVCRAESLCPGHEGACQDFNVIDNAENRGLNVDRSPLVAHCDSHLSGWYQFRHSDKRVLKLPMSTKEDFKCHTEKKCGTEIPVTLRYKETQNDLEVYDGCFDFIWCCLFKLEVCSKECDHGTVYYLSSPFGCPMAYCTQFYTPCGAHQHRDQESGQCVDKFPQNLARNPELSLSLDPENNDEAIKFNCIIHFEKLDTARGNERYEVQWIKNNEQTPLNAETTPYTSTNSKTVSYTLPNDPEHSFPLNIKCRVRSFYDDSRDRHSKWFSSNAFFAGLSVYPSALQLKENSNDAVNIVVQPTIPIVCSKKQKQNRPKKNCAVIAQIQREERFRPQQISASACQLKFTKDNWNEPKSLTIRPLPNMINTQQVTKILVGLVNIFDGEDSPPFQWLKYKPTPITVNVENADAKLCLSYNDPHFKTFDEKYLHYYGIGDFLFAQSPLNNLEVHIRSWKCRNSRTEQSCNCGVAIREGNNVVSVGQCVAPTLEESTFLQVVRHSERPFSSGFRVYRKSETVRVVLSSGSFVDIHKKSFGVNVDLRLSPIYKETTGICGNGNGDPEDDLKGKDNRMHTKLVERIGHADFTETWRLEEKDSFFDKDYTAIKEQTTTEVKNLILQFCECQETSDCPNKISDAVRGPFADKNFAETAAILAKPITSATRKKRLSEQFTLNRRETNQYGWPTKSNITKEMAEEKCRGDLERSFVAQACKQEGFISEIDPFIIEACVEDIKATDDLSWPLSYVKVVQSQCEDTIAGNASYWKEQLDENQSPENNQSSSNETVSSAGETLPNLPVFPKRVVSSFCPNNCSGIGTCVDSKCVCPKRLAGEDCLVDLDKPPQASHLNTGPLCDVNESPCTTLHVIGNNFYDTPSLTCLILVKGSNRTLRIKAKYQSIIDMTCTIPNNILRQTGTAYVSLTAKVAVGKKISKEISYTIYNSSCYKCNKAANCSLKSDMCNIKGKCIENRELCPKLNDPDNGIVQIASFQSQLTANYSCPTGCFVLVGERSQTCNLTNACSRHTVLWSGNPPLCINTMCKNYWELAERLLTFVHEQNITCVQNFSLSKCGMTANLLQVVAKCDNKTLEETYSCTDSRWTLVKRNFT